MLRRLLLALAIGLVVALSFVNATRSQNVLEKLVMPGPLVQGHAKLEGDCAKCHESFSPQSQTRLCVACHKEIGFDRFLSKGFHGRQPAAAKRDCRSCHTDHKGRTFDIVQLDRETFNHANSNFQLAGAHKAGRCEGCHDRGVAFRKAPAACSGCHAKKDPHKGNLGQACDGCHSDDVWRRVKPFDHARTKFALEGAHKDVACAACHVGEQYKGLAVACASCHQLQDVHAGRYGAKCQTCHDQSKWKTVRFDHNKTKYPLRGAHAKVKCDACHPGDLYRDRLATTCLSCHRKDDPHKGQLGPRCEQCHNDASWRKKTEFDHDVSRFPLIGKHSVVPCEECHLSQSYKGAPLACPECHKDQHHEGRVGSNCAPCHNPNAWARWIYNHDKQTKYPLTGAHRNLTCHACHATKNVAKIVIATNCYGCHSRDDAHQGSFGRSCEQCHTTTSFTPAAVRR